MMSDDPSGYFSTFSPILTATIFPFTFFNLVSSYCLTVSVSYLCRITKNYGEIKFLNGLLMDLAIFSNFRETAY